MKKHFTFASRMAQAKGHPSGFDYMRICLATGVLIWHTILMNRGLDVQNDMLNNWPLRAVPELILPMFFALSGFLVTGSLERAHNLIVFLCLRLLRIFPALWCVVALSALVLGPILTSYAPDRYFSDPLFGRYFLTMFGDVQNYLPGVFEHNPFPRVVNGQLFTIPLEMPCYLVLAAMAITGIYRRPSLFMLCVVLAQGVFAGRALFGAPIIWGGVPNSVLVLCFFTGAALFAYRDRIVYRHDCALLSALISCALLYVPGGAYFIAAPVTYITMYLGILNPRKIILVKSGDYSYGIYLFAFPIQQIVASLGPWSRTWYMNLLITVPVTFVFAVTSWHLLEKKCLALRHHIPQFRARVERWLKNVRQWKIS